MKKSSITLIFVFILLIVLGLPWIGAERRKQTEIPQETQSETNFSGTYQGVLPCADCAGIDTTLILNQDGTYTLISQYGDKGIFENTGHWEMTAPDQITLIEDEYSLIIRDTSLQFLDQEGQPATPPSDWTLIKKTE